MILDILKTPEFGQFVANMLLALVAVVVPLVGTAIRSLLKSKANDATFVTFLGIVRTAVMAAEQAGLAGVVTDKKETAIKAAQAMLSEAGIKVDITALDAAIEAMVADELNKAAINEANYKKAEAIATSGA